MAIVPDERGGCETRRCVVQAIDQRLGLLAFSAGCVGAAGMRFNSAETGNVQCCIERSRSITSGWPRVAGLRAQGQLEADGLHRLGAIKGHNPILYFARQPQAPRSLPAIRNQHR